MGMQFLELPANAGWGEMGKIAEKMSSFDDETKTFSAIPSTIFIDEMISFSEATAFVCPMNLLIFIL